jgi:hypothetical protein
MKKILYYSFYPTDASGWYRSTGVLPFIKSDDFTLINLSHIRDISFANLCGYDAIFIQRPCEDEHLKMIKSAKDVGLKVIIDHDDNPLCVPDTNPMHGFFEARKKVILESIVLSDEVWVSTPAIKQAFRLYNKNIHVIPNAHNDYIFKEKDKKPFVYNETAMFRGGHSHLGDMYEGNTPDTVVDFINGNPNWKFYMLGQRFEYIEVRLKHPNYYRHDGATTVQFYKLMHGYNPCLFFYPLSASLFNHSKSNCSWLESTYAGAAVFANKELPEFDKPFIGNFSADILKTSKGKLKKMHDDSWKYIQKNLLLSIVNEKRKERLEKI